MPVGIVVRGRQIHPFSNKAITIAPRCKIARRLRKQGCVWPNAVSLGDVLGLTKYYTPLNWSKESQENKDFLFFRNMSNLILMSRVVWGGEGALEEPTAQPTDLVLLPMHVLYAHFSRLPSFL